MKDPRFNFYVDNWIGGTEGFTLEQEGAYLALIIMQSKVGPFTKTQAIDKLMQKTRGNTAVCTELWQFLLPKFATDGTHFWSERLEKEISKSRNHSQKQTERINKRWGKQNGNTAVLPVNETGSGSGNESEKKEGVQGEKTSPGLVPASPSNSHAHSPAVPRETSIDLQDIEAWTADAISGKDFLFQTMLRNHNLKPNGQLETLAKDHMGKVARYGWQEKIKSQHAFRYSLVNFITEQLAKNPAGDKHIDVSSITLNDLKK